MELSAADLLVLVTCRSFHFVVHFFRLTMRARTDGIGNMDEVMATLLAATKNALENQLPNGVERTESAWKEYIRTCFRSVWIGVAGLDRTGLSTTLKPKLGELFGLNYTTRNLHLTNDVDLLTASLITGRTPPPAIVLVAGTGSVAMRYTWTAERGYVRVARSGGWGNILGDEGGGYVIGLEAIKHTLAVVEEMVLGLQTEGFGEFEHAVIKQLGCHVADNGRVDLLTDILFQHCTQSVKSRIAGIAEVVLRLAGRNKTATAILEDQVGSMISKTLGRLVDRRSSGYTALGECVMILSGGLMKNEEYQRVLQRNLAERKLQFQRIELVDDAASVGVKYLATDYLINR